MFSPQAEAERAEAERRLESMERELERERQRSEADANALTAVEKLLEASQAQGEAATINPIGTHI